MRFDKNTIVIGIDHGWSQMKIANAVVFTSGVREITTEPALFDNVLEYNGKYYKVGNNRLNVKDTKVLDDSFYLLTLAAIAKELEYRCKREVHILIAGGLPIGRFGAEKNDFIEYLGSKKEVTFRFEKKKYKIVIEHVSVYPQGYGAVASKISSFAEKELVVDIGSWTVDIIPVVNHSPDESMCVTMPEGLITCINTINEQCRRQLNGKVDEYIIKQVMMTGTADIQEDYLKIIEKEIKAYCKRIYDVVSEQGYDLNTMRITFVGGGAVVMKRFGEKNQRNIVFIEDVKANAKGFELLGNMYLKRAVGKCSA